MNAAHLMDAFVPVCQTTRRHIPDYHRKSSPLRTSDLYRSPHPPKKVFIAFCKSKTNGVP